MRDEKNLKSALRYWRKRRGKSIERLAKEAHVSTVTIMSIERTNRVPRPDVLARLSQALNITIEELVADESEDVHIHVHVA